MLGPAARQTRSVSLAVTTRQLGSYRFYQKFSYFQLTFKAEFVLIGNWRGNTQTGKVFIRQPILVTPMPPRLDLSPRPLSLPAVAGASLRPNPPPRPERAPHTTLPT